MLDRLEATVKQILNREAMTMWNFIMPAICVALGWYAGYSIGYHSGSHDMFEMMDSRKGFGYDDARKAKRKDLL